MRDPGSPPFSTLALRVTTCHVVTYFIEGVIYTKVPIRSQLFGGFEVASRATSQLA